MKKHRVLIVVGSVTVALCLVVILWIVLRWPGDQTAESSQNDPYVVTAQVEKSPLGINFVWTVLNKDQNMGLNQFAVELPVSTRVLSNSVPPPGMGNPDGNDRWVLTETSEAQTNAQDGQIWLPAPEPGKKWLLWSGQMPASVYPPGTSATFSAMMDGAVKPGKVTVYTTTYSLQNPPHFYTSFHMNTTGPANL